MIEGVGGSAGPSGPDAGGAAAPPVIGSWLRPLVAIVAVLLLLAMVSTALVVMSEGGAGYSADTPQAAIQGWAAAVSRGDYAAADVFLSSNLQAQSAVSMPSVYPGSKVAVAIMSVTMQGDSAMVGVTETLSYPGMDPSQSADQHLFFSMVREGGQWKIDSIAAGI